MHLLCGIQEYLQIARWCQKLENETYDSPVTRLKKSEFKVQKIRKKKTNFNLHVIIEDSEGACTPYLWGQPEYYHSSINKSI